ncbi:hypothetical protein OsJ_17534 [Oryza sativa Japonica Group]|uniref:Uncharacterized protein n=1 Tax=Oryza sativa subsp. japonica TaxID=39947 RepID=B9FIU8_ORYSJ|nr:hypothetical protein OsJ_17534 [Oryza sativa Japonica Group]
MSTRVSVWINVSSGLDSGRQRGRRREGALVAWGGAQRTSPVEAAARMESGGWHRRTSMIVREELEVAGDGRRASGVEAPGGSGPGGERTMAPANIDDSRRGAGGGLHCEGGRQRTGHRALRSSGGEESLVPWR